LIFLIAHPAWFLSTSLMQSPKPSSANTEPRHSAESAG
jgi:hypothetical protein